MFLNYFEVLCNIPSKNASLKMATIYVQNMLKFTLFVTKKI